MVPIMMNCKPRVTKSSLYHIKKLYDDDYVRRQNKWYHDYLKGKGGYSKRIRFLKSIIENISHSMILDLGCGVGTFAIEYAKLGNQTVGLDLSPIAISAAKTNAKAHRGFRNRRRGIFLSSSCKQEVTLD